MQVTIVSAASTSRMDSRWPRCTVKRLMATFRVAPRNHPDLRPRRSGFVEAPHTKIASIFGLDSLHQKCLK
jgi:hypothetical protein